MGYTHYWHKIAELPQDKWDVFTKEAKSILADGVAEKVLCKEHDTPNLPPVANKKEIRFNGKEDEGHETFYFDRKQAKGVWSQMDDKGRYFNFCKTDYRPYDKYVVEILKLAKKCFKGAVSLDSDGGQEVFDEAPALKEAK